MRKLDGVLVFLSVCVWTSLAVSNVHAANDLLGQLEQAGITGGLIVHLDFGQRQQLEPWKQSSQFLVQGLEQDADEVAQARVWLRSSGDNGRITVRHYDGQQLPYADRLVTAIVSEGATNVPPAELQRVLAPNGIAIINGKVLASDWPDDIDQWHHFLHDPDNNAVVRDKQVNAPRSIQWVARPLWGRSHEELASMSGAVTSDGRVFSIVDEAPLATIRFSGDWNLVARDAFNGVLLWKRKIPQWVDHLRHFRSGPAHLARRLAAVDDEVYVTLGLAAPVSALDARTGETRRVYEGTEYAEEILVEEDSVYLVVGSSEVHRSGEGLYRRGEPEPTDFRYVVAFDRQTGRQRWKYEFDKSEFLLPLTLAVRGGRVAFQSTVGVSCLDADTGQRLWRADRPSPHRRMSFSARTLVMADGVVLSADRDVVGEETPAGDNVLWGVHGWNAEGFSRKGPASLQAYDVQTGIQLWSTRCSEGYNSPVDVFVIDDIVWVGSDFKRFELKTGKELAQLTWKVGNVAMAHHRCYRNKATERFILTGRAGVEVIDLQSGWVGNNSWIRGTCQYGIMPANGLLYVPPDACACVPKVKIRGFFAAAPRRYWDWHQGASITELEVGPAAARPESTRPQPSVEDWPMYRSDAARSGAVQTNLNDQLTELWRVDLGGALSQPVVAAGRMFISAIDAHTIYALDASDGRQLWAFTAGGRIDSAPTVYGNLLYFGSADGSVYACHVADGTLAWRCRIAPLDRQICAFEQLESVWPVHGSVLIQNDTLYVTAGRSTYLDGGIILYRLNPRTGEELSRTAVVDIDPNSDQQTGAEDRKIYGFDMEGASSDILSGDGESVFLKHLHFNAQGKKVEGDRPHLFSVTGFLVEDWFVRTYWLMGTDVQAGWGGWAKAAGSALFGRILSFDQERVFGYGRSAIEGGPTGHRAESYQLFRSQRMDNSSTPAEAANRRARRNKPAEKIYDWTDSQSIQVRAMVLSGDKLIVAGPPSLTPYRSSPLRFVNESEALQTFQGEKGVFLQVRSAESGSVIQEIKLPAMPAFDGMSAARGKLFLSLKNGQVICLGEK